MISFLAVRLTQAAESEFPLLRAAGEMSWVLPQAEGAEDFFAYESAVNQIVEDKPAVFMCMYDLQRLGISMLVDVLKTHPKVLLDGMVLDNPNYLAPTALAENRLRTDRISAGQCSTADEPAQHLTRGGRSPMLSSASPNLWPAASRIGT